MKQKTAIQILILLIIIAISVVSFFIFFDNKEGDSQNEVSLPNQPTSNFFPESENFNPNNQKNINQESDANSGSQPINKLRQISDKPTAGFITFDRRATTSNILATENQEEELLEETETVYKYVNRSNGNVFETTSKTSSSKRVTNKTIQKVNDVVFSNDGYSLFYRYLNDNNSIETVFGSLDKEQISTSTSILGDEGDFIDLETTFFNKNIRNIILSDNNKILYTIENNVGLNGFVFDINSNTNEGLVLNTPYSQLNIQWLDENNILLGTKPSATDNGFLFKYNLDNQTQEKILEAGLGFNYLSDENSNYIVYSQLDGNILNSYSYNIESGEVVDLSLNTIVSDKCSFSKTQKATVYCAIPNNLIGFGYPNIWHQGQVSLSDSLYKIDLESGLKIELSGLEDSNFDIFKPQISDNNEYFTFVNKTDLTLWSLDIK